MLRLGRSVPWQDSLEQMTGTREMSARPILEVSNFSQLMSSTIDVTLLEIGRHPNNTWHLFWHFPTPHVKFLIKKMSVFKTYTGLNYEKIRKNVSFRSLILLSSRNFTSKCTKIRLSIGKYVHVTLWVSRII